MMKKRINGEKGEVEKTTNRMREIEMKTTLMASH